MKPECEVVSVIMGGGRGTRLYPLTQDRCKPAVPLAGKYRLVDIPISNCINSGLDRIFLLTQFLTASLHRHVHNSYRFDVFSSGFVQILAAEQTYASSAWYEGTADAVRRNLTHFDRIPHDLVLILSGDQLYRMDLREVIDSHLQSRADVTVAAIPVPVSEANGLGLMRVRDDMSIAEFVEKPRDPAVIESLAIDYAAGTSAQSADQGKRCLASMGIYVFGRQALHEALDNEMHDFGREIIPGLLGRARLNAFVFDGYWEDIGTVRAFFEANLALTDPVPPFNFFDRRAPIFTHARFLPASQIHRCSIEHAVIGDGCILADSTLRRCVIGIRSVLGQHSVLENVVMMGADEYQNAQDMARDRALGLPLVGIGRNCHIRGAIIDKNARIGDGVQLSPEGREDGDYEHGIAIRDGVLCVSRSATVPAGFRL